MLNAVPADDFPKWPEPAEDTGFPWQPTLRDLVKIATCAVSNPRGLCGSMPHRLGREQSGHSEHGPVCPFRARATVKAAEGRAIVPANPAGPGTPQPQGYRRRSGRSKPEICDGYLYFANISSFTRLIEGRYYAATGDPKGLLFYRKVSTAMAGAASGRQLWP